jgi:hypothetical protein
LTQTVLVKQPLHLAFVKPQKKRKKHQCSIDRQVQQHQILFRILFLWPKISPKALMTIFIAEL